MSKLRFVNLAQSYLYYNQFSIIILSSTSPMQPQAPPDKIHELFLSTLQNSPFKNQVIKAYSKLNEEIEQINHKMLKMVQKDESQFVTAYSNLVEKLKKELEDMRTKIEQTQKELRSNDWIVYIQKQTALFREESLQLYDKLQQTRHEMEYYKTKYQDAHKTLTFLQKQIKQHIRNKRLLQISLTNSQVKIAQLEQQIHEKEQKIRQINQTALIHSKTEPIERSKLTEVSSSLIFKLKDSTRLSLRQCCSSTVVKNKSICNSSLSKKNQLQQWFIDCIKSVKKEIANRKNSGLQLNLNAIHSIEEFKIVDKLKLLEKFIENEKLLVWMYEKIFPSRINQVSEYLSQQLKRCKTQPEQVEVILDQQEQLLNRGEKQPISSTTRINISLPRIDTNHSKKFKVRNKVSITQGKLQLISSQK